MNLNPYQSPTIAGQPPAEVPLPFRRRYWFEILIVGDALLLLIVAMVHRSLRGVPEWYHYPPVALCMVVCWLSAPTLAICAIVRGTILLLNHARPWRVIATVSFAILVLLAALTATWIHPRMETDTAQIIADLLTQYWLEGAPIP